MVKCIYRKYLEGSSLLQIGRGLEADGIFTAAGKPKWRPETLQKILQNEKYIGDAFLQKTYTVDFLKKKRVWNNSIVPQYYVENSHLPIIPRGLYMRVQEEMVWRANLHSGEKRKKRVYSSKYALSSIVYCPKCGDIYRRIARTTGENILQSGGAASVWSMGRKPAMRRPFRKQNRRMLWCRRLTLRSITETV